MKTIRRTVSENREMGSMNEDS